MPHLQDSLDQQLAVLLNHPGQRRHIWAVSQQLSLQYKQEWAHLTSNDSFTGKGLNVRRLCGGVCAYKEKAGRFDGWTLWKFERKNSWKRDSQKDKHAAGRPRQTLTVCSLHWRDRISQERQQITAASMCVFMPAVCADSPQWNTAFTSRLSDKNKSGFRLRA